MPEHQLPYQAARGEHPVSHCKIKEMVGPEGVVKSLILLSFSWVKIKNLPVSFRIVP